LVLSVVGLSAASGLRTHRLVLKEKIDFQSAIAPADGTNAAVNSRNVGTFRWQLAPRNYISLPRSGRGHELPFLRVLEQPRPFEASAA
jgi:hypothetical protein